MEPGSAGPVVTGVGIVLEALSRGLPVDRIVVDPDVVGALSHDEAEWAPTGKALAAVRARSEAEVQHVLGLRAVPAGLTTVHMDRDRDLGDYWEPNIWIIHPSR
jgi:hypothetical protein